MAKIILNNLANLNNSVSAVSTINQNNDLIEVAFENTLSRDGSEPNSMNSLLDMNGYPIINLPYAVQNGSPVTLEQLNELVGGELTNISPALKGWSPVLGVATDGARRVLQVVDWTGSVGLKPVTGLYVSPTGLVADISLGVDIRGPNGTSAASFNVIDYGADPTGVAFSQDQIQAAINAAYAAGGGEVIVPVGVYKMGLTSETPTTTYMPAEFGHNYGLIIYSGVTLKGEGYGSRLLRGVADKMVMITIKDGVGSQLRNIHIDGNTLVYPAAGDTYGAGTAVGIESTTVTQDKETVVDTVWVTNTGGYGVGVEWGNHRGCTLRNIFIDGSGSDGIDIKRMNFGSFDAYFITLDNIHVTRFGLTATDAATQAGVDLRGYVLASNIHVYGVWGAQAAVGIRFQDSAGDSSVIGAIGASVTSFFVMRTSGGVAQTYGILNNGARHASFANGYVRGCHLNVTAVGMYATFSAVRSDQAVTYGFYVSGTGRAVQLNACSDYLSPTGFRIEGNQTVLTNPSTVNNGVGTWHIDVNTGAANTFINGHALAGTNAQIVNTLGTNTRNTSYYT